jgi:hypothetical protein
VANPPNKSQQKSPTPFTPGAPVQQKSSALSILGWVASKSHGRPAGHTRGGGLWHGSDRAKPPQHEYHKWASCPSNSRSPPDRQTQKTTRSRGIGKSLGLKTHRRRQNSLSGEEDTTPRQPLGRVYPSPSTSKKPNRQGWPTCGEDTSSSPPQSPPFGGTSEVQLAQAGWHGKVQSASPAGTDQRQASNTVRLGHCPQVPGPHMSSRLAVCAGRT